MLELKDFVHQTLVQIAKGVNAAGEEIVGMGGAIPEKFSAYGSGVMKSQRDGPAVVHIVDFDVAITTLQSEGVEGGAGIFVAFLTAGGKGKYEEQSSTISRVKFPVPIQYPV